jgi:hypothetical protein
VLKDVDWRKAVFVADGIFFLVLAIGFALRFSLAAKVGDLDASALAWEFD